MPNNKDVQSHPLALSNLYYHPGPGKHAWLQRLFAFLPGISVPVAGIVRDPVTGAPTHELFRLGYHPLRSDQHILSKLNLSEQNLSNSDLEGLNFKRAQLNNANLSGTNLANSNLKNCDMENVLLSNTDLRGADLTGANLKNARLLNCQLEGACLKNANLSSAHLEGVLFDEKINLAGCQLSGAQLRDTNFYGVDLSKVRFTEAHLQEVVIQECKLNSTLFERAQLLHVLIDNCHDSVEQESFVSFRGAEIKQSTFQHCTFSRGDFFSTRMIDSQMNDCQFLFGLFMTGYFARCSLHNCRFSALKKHPEKSCDFFKTIFDDCSIQNCDFEGAKTDSIALKNMTDNAIRKTRGLTPEGSQLTLSMTGL